MAEPKQKDLADFLTEHEDRLRGIEQLNSVSWANIRTGNPAVNFSAGQGSITFSSPFPGAALAVVAWAKAVPGFLWITNVGFGGLTPLGFPIVAYQIDPANAVAYVTGVVVIHYIAVGT